MAAVACCSACSVGAVVLRKQPTAPNAWEHWCCASSPHSAMRRRYMANDKQTFAGASTVALELAKAVVGMLCEADAKTQMELSAERQKYIDQLIKRSMAVQASAKETAVQVAKLQRTTAKFSLIPSLAADLRKEDPGLSVVQSVVQSAEAKRVLGLEDHEKAGVVIGAVSLASRCTKAHHAILGVHVQKVIAYPCTFTAQ
jgi:hypothetical protein